MAQEGVHDKKDLSAYKDYVNALQRDARTAWLIRELLENLEAVRLVQTKSKVLLKQHCKGRLLLSCINNMKVALLSGGHALFCRNLTDK